MTQTDKVFVTDALQRKSLVVIRSLGRRGIWVGSGDSTCFTLGGFSRFCRERMIYPSPEHNPRYFAQELARFLEINAYTLLLPIDDASLRAVLEHRDLFLPSILTLLPDYETVKRVGDKGEVMRLAANQGILHPTTYFIKDEDELDHIKNEIRYPTLIRPRVSSGSRGIAFVEESGELAATYKRVASRYPTPLIQEYVPPGDKYDVALLYNEDSQVVTSFVQKEIRNFPLEWGPSTIQESVHRPDLVEQAIKLLAPVAWKGIAEVEFMCAGTNPSAGIDDYRPGTPFLMEVNPRFWNSLHLAVVCGLDFPYLLYRLSREGITDPIEEYIVGRRSRWLWPADVLHALAMLGKGRKVAGFFNFRDPNTFDDTWDKDDRWPIAGLIIVTLWNLFNPNMWRMLFFRKG